MYIIFDIIHILLYKMYLIKQTIQIFLLYQILNLLYSY